MVPPPCKRPRWRDHETADAGKTIKAKIDAYHKNPPIRVTSPVFFKVLASEV